MASDVSLAMNGMKAAAKRFESPVSTSGIANKAIFKIYLYIMWT